MSKEDTRIRKFAGDGFHSWQVLIKYKLMSKGLTSLVYGTRKMDFTNPIDISDDEKAQSVIMLHLDETLVHHVDQLDTAKAKWDELDKLFGASGKNSKISLKIEFFGLLLRPGESISSLVSRMKGLTGQLASIDAQVEDEDSIAVLLKAVQEKYPTLVTTLKNIPKPTLSGVIQSLLDEERSNNGGTTSTPATNSALNVQIIKCSFCKKKGHIVDNCWKKNPSKMKCRKCNQTGHISTKCPNEDSTKEKEKASTSASANTVASASDISFSDDEVVL